MAWILVEVGFAVFVGALASVSVPTVGSSSLPDVVEGDTNSGFAQRICRRKSQREIVPEPRVIGLFFPVVKSRLSCRSVTFGDEGDTLR